MLANDVSFNSNTFDVSFIITSHVNYDTTNQLVDVNMLPSFDLIPHFLFGIKIPVAYPGIFFRGRGGGTTNSVENRGQR